jgi:hypothetical protein
MRIRDPGWKKFGSEINIPDPQHWKIHLNCVVIFYLGLNLKHLVGDKGTHFYIQNI